MFDKHVQPLSASHMQQTPAKIEQARAKHLHFSRRSMLKGTAVVGGSLAVIGGAAGVVQTARTTVADVSKQTAGGQVREYWIQADAFYHNLVPSGYDGMMGTRFQANQSSYWAIGYRAYTPGWGIPLAADNDIGMNNGIPGPILRGKVGDTIRVHFRNNDTHYKFPHSMHPHGVQYTPDNDGGWFAADPRPGANVAVGQTYTYEWQVHTNSVGTWVYHDHAMPAGHSMLMEFGAEVGLFGLLVLTDASTPPVDKEFFTFLHDIYQADVSSLSQDFDCFNGFCYVGNTPTFTASIGQKVRWHVSSLGKEFHAFHLHGHRWPDATGRFVDVVMLGPAMALSFDFVADNPGNWLYHCHVTDHMMGGMTGLYVVTQ